MKLERFPDELREGRDILSPTSLITMFKSPKHFYSKHILKEVETSKAMEDGKIIHKAVLEPDSFGDEYVVADQSEFLVTAEDIKNKIKDLGEKPVAGRKGDLVSQLLALDPNAKIWDVFLDELEQQKKTLVKKEMWDVCERIRAEARNHKWLKYALNGGMVEQPAWWEHNTGAVISMRMDFYHPAMGASKRPVIVDLKKSRSASPQNFSKQIWNDGLFIQAAVYVDGIKAITGMEPLYAWAVVEDKPPYAIETYAADFGMIEAGRAVYNKMINKYFECKATNHWPGYTNGTVTNIGLPAWAFTALDEYAESEIEE